MSEKHQAEELRDAPEYWDALAARVSAAAVARARRTDNVVAFAASGRGWIAATLLVCAAAALFLALRGSEHVDVPESLGPTDAVGRLIAGGPTPPDIGTLLLRDAGTRSLK